MINRILLIALAVISAISCTESTIQDGVSLALAQERKAQITDVSYSLHFTIPESKSDSITGTVDVNFILKEKLPVVLDFRASNDRIQDVKVEGSSIRYRFEHGHIIVPRQHTTIGQNSISVSFVSNDGSLNRSDEFMYTLLVPDRASTVFPCFDQPDLKALFNLSLTIPNSWTALSNGEILNSHDINEYAKQISFKTTQPISTYLFAFAAGKFKQIKATIKGRTFTAYHRETDQNKVNRNLPTLFNLHAQSLNWLENYTEIPYPFEKLDFILIPGFQYSGMEHPGAIFYRDTRLLLDENPTENQKLRQANLIAHEVSHQWFGNLVTMQWFNDVWLKEVFAGFMGDQIVNPQYPGINHELSFMLSHFPSAYSVDRTLGANPIVQNLENMLNAGNLYGDIIYHKAPIMMKQLVLLMGDEPFQKGVQEYLKTYSMGNAKWSELISILDNYTDANLNDWATIWTKETGRPAIEYKSDRVNSSIVLSALEPSAFPPMWIDISNTSGTSSAKRIWLNKLPFSLNVDNLDDDNTVIIANSTGIAYGYFAPDSLTLSHFLLDPKLIEDPVSRAAFHLSLFEMFLDHRVKYTSYTNYLIGCLANEKEPQIQNYLLGVINSVFWRFSSHNNREDLAKQLETVLWKLMEGDLPTNQKRTVFATLSSVFTTNESISKLYSAWGVNEVCGIMLSENERTNLAYELMIRKPELYHTIAFGEVERINNPDRIAQFDFTLDAISPNPSHRVGFFEKLKNPANRKPEPWVTEALRWLHHPLRSDFSIRFVEPSLDLLTEIQRTGDIFFPKSWLDATLWGHSSPEAIAIVDKWVETNPNLSPSLKLKIEQSADWLRRVNTK